MELRVCIYNTKNVEKVFPGTCDTFVKAWLSKTERKQKETDTHWRCKTGEASFNWRMLFPVFTETSPTKEPDAYKLNLEIYDRGIFSGNELICSFELDLFLLFQDVKLTQRTMQINQKYYKDYFEEAMKKRYPVVQDPRQ